MKKIIYILSLVVLMASCAKQQPLEQLNGNNNLYNAIVIPGSCVSTNVGITDPDKEEGHDDDGITDPDKEDDHDMEDKTKKKPKGKN